MEMAKKFPRVSSGTWVAARQARLSLQSASRTIRLRFCFSEYAAHIVLDGNYCPHAVRKLPLCGLQRVLSIL